MSEGRTQVSLSQASRTYYSSSCSSFIPSLQAESVLSKVSPPGEASPLSLCLLLFGWLRGLSPFRFERDEWKPRDFTDPGLLWAQPRSSEASKCAVGKQQRPSCTVFPAGLFLFHNSFTPGHTEGWEDE